MFNKTRGDLVLLNTNEFLTGSGILDENSTSSQKAFKDINDRLSLADENYDGLMSSDDKSKLDNLSQDILYKEEFTTTNNQNSITLARSIKNLVIFVDGIFMKESQYTIIEKKTILFIDTFDSGSEVTVISSSFINTSNQIDDSLESMVNTWSSEKIQNTIDLLTRKYDFTATSEQTDFVCSGIVRVIDVFVGGIKLRDSEYSFNNEVVSLNVSVSLYEWVQVVG